VYIVNPFFFLFTVYITQLERRIGLQEDIINEQQLQFQQQKEELQQQQQLIHNLEQVKVSLEARNTRILGKLHAYDFSILVSLTCLKIIERESKISQESTRNL